MRHIGRIFSAIIIILTSGCAHRVRVPTAIEIKSLEVVERAYPPKSRAITEKSSIDRILEICRSAPAVRPGLLHAAVTYAPSPYAIRFTKTDGSVVVYELRGQSLHTQEATWPISPSAYSELTALLGIKETQL
jgi:hypothetical protein